MISNFQTESARLSCESWSCYWSNGLTKIPSTTGVIALLAATLLAAMSLYACLIRKPLTNFPPLPPGPPGLPVLGNLPFLEPDHLHRYFAKLSEIYGPIIKLQLGRKFCVVMSAPSLAKQVLKDHDAIFANRDPPRAGIISAFGGHDIGWSHGPEWRKLRKIFGQEIMSKTSLDACYALRRQEVREMVKEVYAKVGSPINIGEQVFLTALSVIMSMSWGGSLHGEERSKVGNQFRQVVEQIVELLGQPNVSDFFPALAWLDLQGVESKMKKLMSWFDRFFMSLIDIRTKENKQGKRCKDLLELLLELHQEGDDKSSLSMNQVKALLMDIIVGGTHTSTTTIEWAMTELLQNPEAMRKACQELEEVVGNHNIVEEFHLSKLQYLDAIIKETLRLHPPVPLVPRSPCTSQTILEYTIPKGSMVFFNVWAMQRDPRAWESPLKFRPERFLRDAGKGDYQGNNFNYLPFGSGRRICPGIPLAEKMVPYVLATLLHSFEWKLPEQTKLDLSEKSGLVLKRQEPLIVVASAKLSSTEHYH